MPMLCNWRAAVASTSRRLRQHALQCSALSQHNISSAAPGSPSTCSACSFQITKVTNISSRYLCPNQGLKINSCRS